MTSFVCKILYGKGLRGALDIERVEMRVEWVAGMVQRFLGVARLIEDEDDEEDENENCKGPCMLDGGATSRAPLLI
jgi:hypothetical protein